MDVSDVLRDRMQEPAGLQRMVAASALGHAAILAAVLVCAWRLVVPTSASAPKDR